MLAESVFSRAMEGVTGGVILAAFAIALGATDLEVGIIAAIPFVAQAGGLLAVALVRRTGDPRPIAVFGSFGARTALLLIGVLPFLVLPLPPFPLFVLLLVVSAFLSTVAGIGWQVWIRALVPRDELGPYFGRRFAIQSFVGAVTIIAAGLFVSWWGRGDASRTLQAFGVLFLCGGMFGYVSSALLSRVPGTPLPRPRSQRLLVALSSPFRDQTFRGVLAFLAAWGFAANFSLPFITVVLLRRLGYGIDVVVLLAVFSLLANTVGSTLWAPLSQRFGNKPILGLNASTFLLGMLLLPFLPEEPGLITLAGMIAVHGILGLAISGLDLASNNIVLKLAPDEDAPAHLAAASLTKAVFAGVAPVVAGSLAVLLAGREFTLQFALSGPSENLAATVVRFSQYDFLFLGSVVFGAYAIHRLLGFEERGEYPPEEVVRAMRREVGQVSTVAGMRQFAHLASYVVETAYRFERTVEPSFRKPAFRRRSRR